MGAYVLPRALKSSALSTEMVGMLQRSAVVCIQISQSNE